MKSGLMEKLSSYAALIGVIGAIGGGFYTWGEFNNRLNAVEGKEETTYDISGIAKNAEEIAVGKKSVEGLELSGIAVLEEKIKVIEAKPQSKDWSKDIEVLRKELEYIKLEIEELKLKAKNPLAG